MVKVKGLKFLPFGSAGFSLVSTDSLWKTFVCFCCCHGTL